MSMPYTIRNGSDIKPTFDILKSIQVPETLNQISIAYPFILYILRLAVEIDDTVEENLKFYFMEVWYNRPFLM